MANDSSQSARLTSNERLTFEPDFIDHLRTGRWKTWELPLVADEYDRVLALGETYEQDYKRLLEAGTKMRAEIERLRAALRKYGRHEDLCEAVLTKQLVLPCSCGFKEALAEQPVETTGGHDAS